ncbi:hypothetical protein, partial [Halobacillus seohaensis]
PFNLLAYGPSPNCLRLKAAVTNCPPRLATSEWLVLSRRASHPLYVTTYARSLQESPPSPPPLALCCYRNRAVLPPLLKHEISDLTPIEA